MINYFISFLLRMLKDQRGEAGEDLEADDQDGASDDTDDDDADKDEEDTGVVTLDLGDDADELPGDDDDKDAEGAGDDSEGKPDAKSLSDQLVKLNEDIATGTTKFDDLQKEITEANATLHNLRKEKKTVKPGEEETATFTDEQLKQILGEHEGDTAVMFQVIKQLAKQETSGVKKEAVDATAIAAKQKEFNEFLHERWPDLKESGSEGRADVDKAKEILGVEDHPYGDVFGMGFLMLNQLPKIIEEAKKIGSEEALKGNAEGARKKSIKSNALAGKGKKAGAETVISADQKEAEKALGFKTDGQRKLYRKLLKNAAITVEV